MDFHKDDTKSTFINHCGTMIDNMATVYGKYSYDDTTEYEWDKANILDG